ncbi:MAG: AAA family ATPase [Polyangiaceae bacterium]|nr:AAA family ATPase [Polyangiaceae bacterium]
MPSDIKIAASELEQQVEGCDLEAKLAAGRDGRGEVPKNVYETYSAMANTDGGVILLGVREHESGRLEAVGIPDLPRVQKALWDGLNNRQQVSENILSSESVKVLDVEGNRILQVRVPRASRHQKPVHVGSNPLEGSYRRNHEGDYRCSAEDVRRMLAERVEDERDGRILVGYSLADLDAQTIAKYRQNFRAAKPDHPWNSEPDAEFLRLIGGYRRNRESGEEGVTEAGLLMFGKLAEIHEHFPHFMLDFQERAEAKTQARWIDRVTLDGTWSGNLFDFYQLAMPRLVRDLKVPFELRGDTRVDDTPVHEALREALVNTLIHADYSGRISVLVVKRPDLFGFRNPGAMRMAVDVAVQGGVSDCRNRRLQTMFRHVGLGEQAGSGLSKVYASWRLQHWRAPELADRTTPYEQTVFTLRTVSLLPETTVSGLQALLGEQFRTASEIQKLAMVTVALERKVTHARLRSMSEAHPRDITVALAALVQRGILETGGAHKRTYYYFPGQPPPDDPALGFEAAGRGETPPPPAASGMGAPAAADPSFQHGDPSFQHSDPSFQHSDPSFQHSEELMRLAAPFRAKRRMSGAEMEAGLLQLCDGRFLTVAELARLTGRSADTLRNHHLTRMVSEGKLRLQHPDQPTHPVQAYTKA